MEIRNPKSEAPNKSETLNSKNYNLEDRTLLFGKRILRMCSALPKNYANIILRDQCLRSGTSVGANYREANETDSKKDFQNKVRIAKKEAKETIYWLNLVIDENPDLEEKMKPLLEEAVEIMKILGAIYSKGVSY